MANIVQVAVLSNRQKDSIEQGLELPTLFQMETPSSTTFVIDSKDRITGNLSSFIVDMGYQVSKARFIQLKRVIIPKIPNITLFNNTIRMRSEFGGGTLTADFSLQIGLYNTTALSNALVTAINAAFVAAGIVDSVTCTFDPITRTFSLSSVNGIALAFDQTCSFIQYGSSMVPFESQSVTQPATKTTLYSATAGMLYTRYITVSSDTITQYSVGDSIMSTAKQPSSIIGIIDLVDLYTPSDWDITSVYNGIYRSIDVSSPPKLNVANGSRTIPSQLDITVRDMYSNEINSIVQLGSPYPDDDSSITLIFELSF